MSDWPWLYIRGIEESSVYQDIFAKGFAKGLAKAEAESDVKLTRKILLGQARRRLGEPDERVLNQFAAIDDLDRLDDLWLRLLDVSSWDELLPPAESSA